MYEVFFIRSKNYKLHQLYKKYSLLFCAFMFFLFFSFFNTIFSHLILLYYHTSIHPINTLSYFKIPLYIYTYIQNAHTIFIFFFLLLSVPLHIYIYIYLFSTTTGWCSWTCSTRSHSSICISLFPFCWF